MAQKIEHQPEQLPTRPTALRETQPEVEDSDAVWITHHERLPFYRTRTGKIGGALLALATAGGIGGYVATRGEEKPRPVVVVVPNLPENSVKPVETEAEYEYPVAEFGELIDQPVPLPKLQNQEQFPEFNVIRQLVETRWLALKTNNLYLLRKAWADDNGAGFQEDKAIMEGQGPLVDQIDDNPEYLRIDWADLAENGGTTAFSFIAPDNSWQSMYEAELVNVGDRLEFAQIEPANN